jgi:mannose-6-phosphate isomerase-like protein (cupin superfamily)
MNTPTHETPIARVWYLRTAEDTGGRLHEQRVEYSPGSPFPPAHYHPAQDEYFEIESGSMVFVVGGEERVVEAGGSISVPAGTRHMARNASQTDAAVVRWETTPALRTGEFFSAMAALGSSASVLDRAATAWHYRDVYRGTGALSVLTPVVSAVAWALGRRLTP